MHIKYITKLVIAVILTISTLGGSGVIAEQMRLEVTPSVYAGPCTSGSGGGC